MRQTLLAMQLMQRKRLRFRSRRRPAKPLAALTGVKKYDRTQPYTAVVVFRHRFTLRRPLNSPGLPELDKPNWTSRTPCRFDTIPDPASLAGRMLG